MSSVEDNTSFLISVFEKLKGVQVIYIVKLGKGAIMAIISYKTGSVQCYDCVIALKKFIGSLDGVESIEMDGEDKIDISYDDSLISEDKLTWIVGESVDKLGFKVERCR